MTNTPQMTLAAESQPSQAPSRGDPARSAHVDPYLLAAIEGAGGASAQLLLDSLGDAILVCDAAGRLCFVNPAAERQFGYTHDGLLGERLERIFPQLVAGADALAALDRATGPHHAGSRRSLDTVARRQDGSQTCVELTVGCVNSAAQQLYIISARDAAHRGEAEVTLRESEARYRTLVDHAPDAITVLDVDLMRFVDVNDNALEFFKLDRERLLQLGPLDVSPAEQPDGRKSAQAAQNAIRLALDGLPQKFEWTHTDALGNEVCCEVHLVRLPRTGRNLIRGSITDITERKRVELMALGEREVFELIAGNAPLQRVLESITRLIESICRGNCCSVSVLAADGRSFSEVVAPRLPDRLRAIMHRTAIDIRNGSCAAAVYLGRQVLVADVASDAFWQQRRDAALEEGLRAVWSNPIKAASGRVLGALGVYSRRPGLPAARDLEHISHASRLASIAIERSFAEAALRSSEGKFRGLYESIMEGVFQSTPEGEIISVNPAVVTMLGFESAEEIYALPSAAMIYWNPADRAGFARALAAYGEVHNAEYEMRRRDGQQIVVLVNARAVRDPQGRVLSFEGTMANITERRRAERLVFEEKERAQVTLQSIGDAVISTDAQGLIDYVNPIAEMLTGWTVNEARGRPIASVLHLVDESSRGDVESPLLRCLRVGDAVGLPEQNVLLSRNGQEVAIHNSAAPIRNRAGETIGAVTVFRDITREHRLKRALSYQATHDALTGLINRREFDTRLQDAVESARRGAAEHVLLYVDLDQFKVVNDTCGHPAGDRLLRDVTALLQGRVRAADTIARLGGDEFGVLLESCTLEQAQKIAESIRAAIRDYRFVWNDNAMSIGASIGLVRVCADTESVANLMSAVDIACYAAKDAGRNRVHVYDRSEVSGRHREMYWVARISRAVEEDRLELFCQPIVPVRANAVGMPVTFQELLVRLRDEQGQLVSPGEFIPAAERYNVMSAIDRWVVQRAVERVGQYRARGNAAPLFAVNLSGTSLNDQSFLEFVLAALEDRQLASGLCFEITETAAVANLNHAVYFMRELRSRGCRFALDDFGSGLSSFRYLKTLPVDFLKIDGQFVGNVATDPVDRSMVEAICQVGRTLGISTIAERVESADVLATLSTLGVDYAQGYFLGYPEPAAKL